MPCPSDAFRERTNAGKGAALKSKEDAAREKAEARRAKLNRKATNSAAGLVGWRPRSERELREKLADKEHDAEAIEVAVTRIQELASPPPQSFLPYCLENKLSRQGACFVT